MQTGNKLHHSEEYNAFLQSNGLPEVKSKVSPKTLEYMKTHQKEVERSKTIGGIIFIACIFIIPFIVTEIISHVFNIEDSNDLEGIYGLVFFPTILIALFITKKYEQSGNDPEKNYRTNIYNNIITSMFPNAYSINEDVFVDNAVGNTYSIIGLVTRANEAAKRARKGIISLRNNGLYEGGEDFEKLGEQKVAYAYNLGDRNNTQIANVSVTHTGGSSKHPRIITDFLGITLKCNFNTNGRWIRVVPKAGGFLQANPENLVRTEDTFLNENYNIYSNDAIWARTIITADIITLIWTWIDYNNPGCEGKVSFVIANNELAVSWFNGQPVERSRMLASGNYTLDKDYNEVRTAIGRVYELADLMVCNQ